VAERHSALHGIPGTGSGKHPGITVRLLRDFSLYQLSHWPDQRRTFAEALREAIGLSPDATPGRATGNGSRWLLSIGPDTHWLLAHEGEPLNEALREQIAADIGTVGDLGHARVGLRLSGPEVRAVLAKGLPIDLHPRVFPAGSVAVSAIHGIDLVLHRHDEPSGAFDLYVPRSYAGDFWHWLSDAAAEFGYQVD
jgi:methylglutamate dehydrogenase subunit D